MADPANTPPPASADWYQRAGDDWLLYLYIQPGARKTEVVGLFDGALKIRLAAPAVEGQANAALIAWLASEFAVPKRQVSIRSGEQARRKRVAIQGSLRLPTELWSSPATSPAKDLPG